MSFILIRNFSGSNKILWQQVPQEIVKQVCMSLRQIYLSVRFSTVSTVLYTVCSVYSDIFAVSIQVGSIHEKRQKCCATATLIIIIKILIVHFIVHVVYIFFIHIHVAK